MRTLQILLKFSFYSPKTHLTCAEMGEFSVKYGTGKKLKVPATKTAAGGGCHDGKVLSSDSWTLSGACGRCVSAATLQ
jgi:hypothetical protein